MAAPFRIVGLQIAAVVAVCLLMSFCDQAGSTLLAGPQLGSALLGGAVVVLPNAIFALGAARRLSLDGDDARLREARRLVGHGVFKWLLTAVLMAAAFALATIEPLGFFAALTVAIMVQMIAPVLPRIGGRA
ncbi:MAG: ATP synthase subunit I [Gammaproteobacteria bacterium]|nr:ATP synthase subunit I [Gammaproteobacteria bacterium]